jgi:hypothetical protein
MKKGVKREILFFVSGIMWIGVGIMLNILSFGWFSHSNSFLKYYALILGFLAGFVVAILGFGKLAKKNIKRIFKLADYTCIFNFQEVKSYFIIIFMIGLGIFMRKSGYFPKEFLSFVYTTIGTGLFLSGLLYFQEFIKNI